MAFDAERFLINDKSDELIQLYRCIAQNNAAFYAWVASIARAWKEMLPYAASTGVERLFAQFRADKIDAAALQARIEAFVTKNEKAIVRIIPDAITMEKNVFLAEIKKNLARKLQRIKKLEREKCPLSAADISANIQTAFMSALYMYFRALYNDSQIRKNAELHTALFLFIRNYAYSGMFRYNDAGEFNVPYGGTSYNAKSLEDKIAYYQSAPVLQKFAQTKITTLDFADFFAQNEPQADDFVFLDPPYDSEFSTYAQNDFTKADQARLAQYLCAECKSRWMLVIKETPYITSLYDGKGLHIQRFDKTYTVSFMNRNEKKAEHLLITNYATGGGS